MAERLILVGLVGAIHLAHMLLGVHAEGMEQVILAWWNERAMRS